MSEADEIRLVVKTKFRNQMRNVMAFIRTQHGLALEEIVCGLQLAIIFAEEEAKQKQGRFSPKLIEFREVATLELIAELGKEMAREP